MKNKTKILFFIILMLIVNLVVFINNPSYAAEEDIVKGETYDVILFWGQSNMRGSQGNESVLPEEYDSKSSSWKKEYYKQIWNKKLGSASTFSNDSEIRLEILNNTKSFEYTDVKQVENTAFEYLYYNDSVKSLTKLSESSPYLG